MLKRPVNSRFNERIIAGIKITTIREKPWPVGKPIMLYNWSGKPYGSPQRDVVAVEVTATTPITITHSPTGRMFYKVALEWWWQKHVSPDAGEGQQMLWQCEGFDSQDDMDAWFRAVLKPGTTTEMHLCRFKVIP